MAGKIKKAIDEIILQRSKGVPTLASTTRTKLIIKGINPDSYQNDSPDDLEVIEKIRQIANEFNVKISI
jgi:hypothetical protein